MKTYPIKTISIDTAMQLQFKLIDTITKHFNGTEILNLGDLGVVQPFNQPIMTKKIEAVLAEFFGSEAALLVRGAGTGALRYSIYCALNASKKVLVHDAPIYPTTKTTLEMVSANIITADFNDVENLTATLDANSDIECVVVQYTRQKPDDSYDYEQVIRLIASKTDAKIVTDDNYAALKVEKLGINFGASVSTFSAFKLQGPEGVGVILGDKDMIAKIKTHNYSGGSQVQGYEAHEALRGLINAPVSLAIQSLQVDAIVEKINTGVAPEIQKAFVANAQSKVVIVKFNEKIAKQVLIECEKLGSCPNPVGAESKYEFVPMFYKVSGTFLMDNPENGEYMIRINPMRASSETVLRILQEGIKNVS